MKSLSHRLAVMSIAAAALIGSAAQAGPAATSPYYGRWVSSDSDRSFSARGRDYRTVDIAPCGNDFCGVSVGANGQCGPVLFRFLAKRANADDALRGHGKWGKDRKNVVIYYFDYEQDEGGKQLELYLGKGYDFGERSDNMPSFHTIYAPKGKAVCKAR